MVLQLDEIIIKRFFKIIDGIFKSEILLSSSYYFVWATSLFNNKMYILVNKTVVMHWRIWKSIKDVS